MDGLAYWLAAEMITNSVVVGNISAAVFSRHWQTGGGDVDVASDGQFARSVASKVQLIMSPSSYVFAIASPDLELHTHISIFSSSARLVRIIAKLVEDEFIERLIEGAETTGPENEEYLYQEKVVVGWMEMDERSLFDLMKGALGPMAPPPGSRGIDEILARARARLHRVDPQTAFFEHSKTDDGHAILVDIRPEAQRMSNGMIPGAVVIERNVLEWRFDPRCDSRLPFADRFDLRVIVFCQEGYTSSLAAASLQDLGLTNSTDMEGGFAAWKAEGLPIHDGTTSSGSLVL